MFSLPARNGQTDWKYSVRKAGAWQATSGGAGLTSRNRPGKVVKPARVGLERATLVARRPGSLDPPRNDHHDCDVTLYGYRARRVDTANSTE